MAARRQRDMDVIAYLDAGSGSMIRFWRFRAATLTATRRSSGNPSRRRRAPRSSAEIGSKAAGT
jgi:hypothetical protein